MTVWKIYISTFTRFIANKLGILLTLGRNFSMQTLKLSLNSCYFFKKLNMWWKQVVCSLVSIYLNSPQLAINKNKLYKTLDYWSRDMLNFNFSEKSLELVSPPHILYDFSRKLFLMLHSINWPNFIVWLPLVLEILGNKYITDVC